MRLLATILAIVWIVFISSIWAASYGFYFDTWWSAATLVQAIMFGFIALIVSVVAACIESDRRRDAWVQELRGEK